MKTVAVALSSIALVLSGGGGKGAYEIGAWRALTDLGFEIGGVYGTSVGAINGAAIVLGEFEKARDAWLNVTFEDVMRISPGMEKLLRGKSFDISLSELRGILNDFFGKGGIDVTPLKDLLKKFIPEDAVRSSKIDYGLMAYSMSRMEPMMLFIEDIPQGMLADYILASANFPAFTREEIRGELFIDGGVYSNIPLKMAQLRGFKKAVVVDIGTRTLRDILTYISTFSDLDVVYIRPREHFGGLLTFDPEVSRKYLLEGYLDTMAAYGVLHGRTYYCYHPEDILGKLFMTLSSDQRKIAADILGVRLSVNAPAEYQYTHEILPKLRLETLSVENESSAICLRILETLAKFFDFQRLRPYTPSELLEGIAKKYDQGVDGVINSVVYKIRYEKIASFLYFLWRHGNREVLKTPPGYDEFLQRFEGLLTAK
ncbi:MAG: patatin-like phospholipase family protein [Thermotogae bacterium]|nr:MAG: patatin-like phospholipase family protein [Thermotogota bacterium]